MTYKVELKQLPPEKIMYKHVAATIDTAMQIIPAAFDELYKYLLTHKAQLAGKGYSIYETMNMTDGRFEQDCAFTVTEFVPESDDIRAKELSGGAVAALIHKGPYTTIDAAYKQITKWIKDNGYILNGDVIESNLNDPKNQDEALVEIIWPIRKSD